ncbi:hypothetical protein CMV_009879 [Castanea mollissima]|uniref:Uncharacterized protein n=1 Tax=Castanea mollissima TaxID=60419 RepID=A0A8J4RK70_9ROSI|nr:hypothetical protein CMV_009879 [Castanea mollissima]
MLWKRNNTDGSGPTSLNLIISYFLFSITKPTATSLSLSLSLSLSKPNPNKDFWSSSSSQSDALIPSNLTSWIQFASLLLVVGNFLREHQSRCINRYV